MGSSLILSQINKKVINRLLIANPVYEVEQTTRTGGGCETLHLKVQLLQLSQKRCSSILDTQLQQRPTKNCNFTDVGDGSKCHGRKVGYVVRDGLPG